MHMLQTFMWAAEYATGSGRGKRCGGRCEEGVFTYRNEHTLRLATDAHAAKECAQCNQYANCQEHI